MKKLLSLALCLFFIPLSWGQSTRADSLRGGLRPERTCFDVSYYHLTLTVDTLNKSIAGNNLIVFKVLQQSERIQLDLFSNMTIDSIVFRRLKLNYKRDSNAVFVDFPGYLMQGNIESIKVYYHGIPLQAKKAPWDGGFVWKKNKNNQWWIGVACEGIGASLWWPNKDHLSDEPDSMRMSFEVPKGLQCVSNGQLEKQENLPNSSWFHWKVSYPINNYNVTLNIGEYVHFQEYYLSGKDSMPCDYYVLPYHLDKAKIQFTQVKPMLKIYEELFGKYPFWNDGFALVETPYLGMEHQGAISYGNKYMSGYLGHHIEGIDFDYIIIHESGHEYWGNSISMNDLADMWIHEGFCTYTEVLYVEKKHGYNASLKYIESLKSRIDNDKPVIAKYNVNQEGSGDMYNKGALMLHTIRNIVNNDSLWFAVIKELAVTFNKKNVNTIDVEQFMSTHLKKDLSPVFNQYLRNKEIPQLKVQIKKLCKTVEVSYELLSQAPKFTLPILYSLENGAQNSWQILWMSDNKGAMKITKKQYKKLKYSTHLHLFSIFDQTIK